MTGTANFCDASVAPKTAAGLHHWATERVRYPSIDQLNQSFEIRYSEELGVHAAARRSFDAGEVIISEDPLLRLLDVSPQTRRTLQDRYPHQWAFIAPAFGVKWSEVSKEARKASLDLFYSHPYLVKRSQEVASETNRAAKDLLNEHKVLQNSDWKVDDLVRFMHVVDLNIHKDDERPQSADFTGIFVLGSKFSHSCAPNSAWAFNERGELRYQAIRPIKPGELFTFSYVGNGMNLVVSTIERRKRLSQLWFLCQCSRCSSPDFARQLRCPRCTESRCMPSYGKQDVDPSCPSTEVSDAPTWRCAACDATFSKADMPLEEEMKIAKLVPQTMQGPPERANSDAITLGRIRLRIGRLLGNNHWTWFLATFAWLQKCLVRLREDPVIGFNEAEMRTASTAVARWLEEFAPDNVEQRLSAFFIAARLARQLGEGVRAWGYDPAKPLGELEGLARIEKLGWRLTEDAVHGPSEYSSQDSAPPSMSAGGSEPRFMASWR
eukprot:TRINITY_DN3038_c3_g5_i1.p1 TRINITY_DN3038_c3_g5~~TRINITY_DN3038_c3_g5_i1.p1  ORF type:complete len:494 (-),score=70.31 TRINITY_DN3038_c3_g5_i1:109-1590(-)